MIKYFFFIGFKLFEFDVLVTFMCHDAAKLQIIIELQQFFDEIFEIIHKIQNLNDLKTAQLIRLIY